jgi:hypothetical protein
MNGTDLRFARSRAVADAVMLEGYLLYPYRASTTKNQLRWQFGVVAPRRWSEATGSDPSQLDLYCLVQATGSARLSGQLRFLQLRRRMVQQATEAGDAFLPVASLELNGRLYLPWDEGEVREVEVQAPLTELEAGASAVRSFRAPGQLDLELFSRADGAPVGRLVRETLPLAGELRVFSECLLPDQQLYRVQVRVENHSDGADPQAGREESLRTALLGAHLLLAVEGGRFISLLDPPAWAAAAARSCSNCGLYPVLVEEGPGQDAVLAAPYILDDYPRIAPESHGDFFDATEIDELLTLRTLTLTDQEKRELRATDDRAGALLDRVEASAPSMVERLHGAFRELPPAGGVRPGARVRLRPGPRRTDAQDMFAAGKVATVEAVMRDVDGRDCLAVTIDEDPARELYRAQGRFLYFFADEVEPT